MKKDDCIFCKIANGEIPSTTVYEDERFRVILDLGPASRGHALILPKNHYEDITGITKEDSAEILPLAGRIGRAMKEGLGCQGFNLVQNNGKAAGQTVMHLHIHVIPRYEDGPDMVSWTPGKPTAEEMACTEKKIREALEC